MRIPKILFPLMLFILGLPFIIKGQQKDSLIIQLSRKWSNSKIYALKIASLMPENNYEFKPVPGEMGFKEQLIHIASNINWLSSKYLNGSDTSSSYDAKKLNKEEVLKILGEAYDNGLQAHKKISERELNEWVSFFAGPLSRWQILELMHDHQSHHLGQLIVYLRLRGINPPDYIGW